MTRNERRAAARELVIDELERKFYDSLAEIAEAIASGQVDFDLLNSTPIGITLLAEAPEGGWMAQ